MPRSIKHINLNPPLPENMPHNLLPIMSIQILHINLNSKSRYYSLNTNFL